MLINKLISAVVSAPKNISQRRLSSKSFTPPQRDVFVKSNELKRHAAASKILSRDSKFTIDSYNRLTEEENTLLREVADMDTKLAVNSSVDLGLKFKSYLDEKYGKDKYVFVSIGTSPTGIARVMEFTGVETKYLPVTDLARVSSESDIDAHKDKYPVYKEFLKQQGITSEDINSSGKKYLFYDYTFTGKSLKIFEILMEHEFGVTSPNIEYRSLNGDLNIAANSVNNMHREVCEYVEEYFKDSSMAQYGGVPHLRLDQMDKVFEQKQYYGNAPNLFNFLMIHILSKSNCLKQNPKNKNSI